MAMYRDKITRSSAVKAPNAGRKRRIQAVSVPCLHVPAKKWDFQAKHRANGLQDHGESINHFVVRC